MISSIDNDSIIGIDSLFNKKTEKFDLDLDKFIHNKYSVDEHLADMLVLPASLANGNDYISSQKYFKTSRDQPVCCIKNYWM